MKYFTDTVSDALMQSLKAVGYFQANPTYAEVLDWLKEQDIDININYRGSNITEFSTVDSVLEQDRLTFGTSFKEGIENVIFLALEFIDNDLENK